VTVVERDTLKAPRSPAPSPGTAELVELVERLTERLTEQSAVAAMWQERARMLGDQLALAAPQQPQTASGAPDPPAPTTDAPGPLPARLRALVPWMLLAAILLLALALGWPSLR
jgi:hypothetical protein